MKKCPTCQKNYTDKENKETIERLGECIPCDHIRGDLNQDDLKEYNPEEVE